MTKPHPCKMWRTCGCPFKTVPLIFLDFINEASIDGTPLWNTSSLILVLHPLLGYLLQFINRVAPENSTFLYFSDIFFSHFIRNVSKKEFFAFANDNHRARDNYRN